MQYTTQEEKGGLLKIWGRIRTATLRNPKYDNQKPSVFDMFKAKSSSFKLAYMRGEFTQNIIYDLKDN